MGTHQLQRAQWRPYFDWVSKNLVGFQAEIETAGLKLGDQINQEWILLNGLVYDPKDDLLEIATGDLDHLIYHPRDIYVDDAGTMLRSIEVIDAEGNRQIVKLRQPIPLPAPA